MIRHTFTAFGGARCDVLALGARESDISAVVAEVYAFQARLTRFDRNSELSRFNDSAGSWTEVSPLLNELLVVALEASTLSGGLVNVAVHSAVIEAGYDQSITVTRDRERVARQRTSCPPVALLSDVLQVGEGRARLAVGQGVDLGGIGKGWLADRLCERFDNALVNLGGDLRARGGGPDGCGWAVGLCDGRCLVVTDGGVATSGVDGRRWAGGHHLIDPRTGASSATDVRAVSVAATDALTAEILAKGGVLVGADRAADWITQRGGIRCAVKGVVGCAEADG